MNITTVLFIKAPVEIYSIFTGVNMSPPIYTTDLRWKKNERTKSA